VDIPALLTSPSIPPNSATVKSATPLPVLFGGDVVGEEAGPASPSRSAVAAPSSWSTSVSTTPRAGRDGPARRPPRPAPRAPPVITMVLAGQARRGGGGGRGGFRHGELLELGVVPGGGGEQERHRGPR